MRPKGNKMANDGMNPVVEESLSIRYEDVVITVSADKEGVLQGKTNEQIVKFCADLLLRTTDENSLENLLDVVSSIQETLEEVYGWNKLDSTNFMAAWRKKLYNKQIGLENPPIENVKAVGKTLPVEPSSDPEENATPQVTVADNNLVTISIPVSKKMLDKSSEPNTFTVVEKDK